MTMDTGPARVPTGIVGLDAVLGGGLPRGGLHLVRGGPGTGKTTAGLQFLLQGVEQGERVLYLTLSQTEAGLARIARSHGWSLEGMSVQELATADLAEQATSTQTLFRSADIELNETLEVFLEAIERLEPTRVVFDSMTELRLLAGDSLRYRRQMLGLRQFLTGRACTALLLEDTARGDELGGLLDGLLELEQTAPEYGNVRRRLRLIKLRGVAYHGGYHNFEIRTGALEVFPRLVPLEEGGQAVWKTVASGLAELDTLLGGGLEEGTACLLMGPTGTGKTTVATLYAYAAVQRGQRAAVFLFDERPETFHRRSEGLGMNLRPLVEQGLLNVRQIDTGELSPGEFAQQVRRSVDEGGAKVVLIDSLSGYFHAMPQEDQLVTQMHELLTYLGQRGVLSLLIVGQHGVIGTSMLAPVDVSYMADTVLLLRHFEAFGTLRKALSVVKKRYGVHETTIRELRLTPGQVQIGEPIREFSGVLAGSPAFQGNQRALLGDERAAGGTEGEPD